MIGDTPKSNTTVQIPTWDYRCIEDPMAHIHSTSPDVSRYESALSALQRFLPSSKEEILHGEDGGSDDFHILVDVFSCEDFRMFDFKVKKCARYRSHDWMECPFAHPGKKDAGGISENIIISALLAQISKRVCVERVTPVSTSMAYLSAGST
ncbi:Zinc finger CCCH domain-containing protein 49 [Forsythia ovata]|uniref:Zinc finger CCCH domain-containing protein 49 n=1 Tax=Forsythia ovata TaxID=205694 RepID=A0ABD1VJY5_9LAMI